MSDFYPYFLMGLQSVLGLEKKKRIEAYLLF